MRGIKSWFYVITGWVKLKAGSCSIYLIYCCSYSKAFLFVGLPQTFLVLSSHLLYSLNVHKVILSKGMVILIIFLNIFLLRMWCWIIGPWLVNSAFIGRNVCCFKGCPLSQWRVVGLIRWCYRRWIIAWWLVIFPSRIQGNLFRTFQSLGSLNILFCHTCRVFPLFVIDKFGWTIRIGWHRVRNRCLRIFLHLTKQTKLNK